MGFFDFFSKLLLVHHASLHGSTSTFHSLQFAPPQPSISNSHYMASLCLFRTNRHRVLSVVCPAQSGLMKNPGLLPLCGATCATIRELRCRTPQQESQRYKVLPPQRGRFIEPNMKRAGEVSVGPHLPVLLLLRSFQHLAGSPCESSSCYHLTSF